MVRRLIWVRPADLNRVCIQLAETNAQLAAALMTIERVRARHQRVDRDGPTPTACSACVAGYDPRTGDLVMCAWPCPTLAALDGQRPAERCPSKITNGVAVMQCVGRVEPFEHLHSAGTYTWLSGDENELIETSSAAPGLHVHRPVGGEGRTDG